MKFYTYILMGSLLFFSMLPTPDSDAAGPGDVIVCSKDQ
jgi:hypothetical protein